MTRVLAECIREYRIDCLRIDFNINPLPSWQSGDKAQPDCVGMTEMRYVEGLYRMWDELRAEFPRLFIDNCASGGCRLDLETCARAIPLWRTDFSIVPCNTHNELVYRRSSSTSDADIRELDDALLDSLNRTAMLNQAMKADLNRYLPFSLAGTVGTAPYYIRSGFNYGIHLADDILAVPDYPAEQLRYAIAEANRIRKYCFGDFYPLTKVDTDPANWCAIQYHRPQEDDGMVMLFRRHEAPERTSLTLQGIDPEAEYQVRRACDYQPAEAAVLKGADLLCYEASIQEQPGSLLVEYAKASRNGPTS